MPHPLLQELKEQLVHLPLVPLVLSRIVVVAAVELMELHHFVQPEWMVDPVEEPAVAVIPVIVKEQEFVDKVIQGVQLLQEVTGMVGVAEDPLLEHQEAHPVVV